MTRKLHIGGTVAREGWEILNAIPEPWVDHIGIAEDLSRFEDNTFAEVYASHVLEHLGYQSALPAALSEWHRVLVPEGRLMVSVPDLDTLCELYTQRDLLGAKERFSIMRMMFGGQVDQYDFHCVGLNEELLTTYLTDAGFTCIKRVHDFGLFADSSTLGFAGRPISLNLEAQKSSLGKANSPSDATAAAADLAGGSDPVPPSSIPSPEGICTGDPAGNWLQASAGWGGGYYTGLTYGCFSFRELAPNWLDFALLSQRQRPPRAGGEGSPFRYLELGSGMGLGLCLLAAAYPEGTFIGIDFHPSHIAHSQWLAAELGLANVSFHEADFLELAAVDACLPFDSGSGFHYAVAHGILSWIGPEVRASLLQLAGMLLRPGGVLYCSYNTYPGWLDRTAFKALADLERQRLGPGNLPLALQRTCSTLERLLQSSPVLAASLPRLSGQVQMLSASRDIHYLCGEFPEHWQPFYVGQVHQLASTHKLIYTASASLPDNFHALLPSPLSDQLTAETDPTIRQALQDLAINQTFRRDLFVKGPLRLSRVAQEQQLSQLRLRLTSVSTAHTQASSNPVQINTNLGSITLNSDRLRKLEAFLAQQPCTLEEIQQDLEISPEELIVFTSLLLHAGRVALDRGPASEAATASCCAVNRKLMELMQTGHNLGFLAAPFVGHGAQSFSLIDVFVLDGLQQGLDDDILSSCVLLGLQSTGAELRGPGGNLLTDPDECLQHIQGHISQFRSTTLPRLEQLGIAEPLQAT